MSQILALELCDATIRGVAASLRAGRAVVEKVFSGELLPESDGGPSLGKQLGDLLAHHGLSRGDVIAAVSRAKVELRQMALPPAPDDELPEMVHFQASQEFNELTDDWLLDFLTAEGPADQSRSVLAAAIRPELAQQVRAACDEAGCHLKRLVLRPCATASLSARISLAPPDGLRLLIALFGGEAELTAADGQRVLLARAARLPGDPIKAEYQSALLHEIRRTLASIENQAGRTVDRVVLFGEGESHRLTAARIEDELGVEAEVVDPLEAISCRRGLKEDLRCDRSALAPLLGMLMAEADGASQGIDFLNPRKRAEPPSRRNYYALSATLAFLLVVAGFGYSYWERSTLENEVETLNAQLVTAKKAAAAAKKLADKVKEIEKWTAGDVVWLDELDYLSRNAPPAKDAMLTQLGLASLQSGGEMKLEGLAQGDAIDRMASRLRNKGHRMVSKESSNDASHKGYGWRFSASLLVGSEKK